LWGHLLVARGAAHAMIEAAPLSLWDVAALQPIVARGRRGGQHTVGRPWSEGHACSARN